MIEGFDRRGVPVEVFTGHKVDPAWLGVVRPWPLTPEAWLVHKLRGQALLSAWGVRNAAEMAGIQPGRLELAAERLNVVTHWPAWRIVMHDVPAQYLAEAGLEPPRGYQEPAPGTPAAWLQTELASGGARARDIWHAAQAAGISESELHLASVTLPVATYPCRDDTSAWCWRLAAPGEHRWP